MAPNGPEMRRMLLIVLLQYLVLIISSALHLHLILMLKIYEQQQALKHEVNNAIQNKNKALARYKQLRGRFIRKKKRHWKNPGRTEKWWANMWNGVMLPEEWLMNFRMSKEDFMNLERILRPHIRPSQRSFRGDTISSIKKLAMSLYYLKDQGSLRMTSNIFGVAPSTLSHTIRRVCLAISNVLGPQLIKFPATKDGLETLMLNFQKKFGFPMVVGCIDGTHIPIRQPNENPHDYFCYKMRYSINMQAVCDQDGCFLDIDCSWPGSVHDAKIFANSSMNKLFQEKILPTVERKLNADDDIAVGPVLIGDPAYPLLPNVLKEYCNCTSNEEVIFNQKLRSVRNQIECAFGRLKARWRILNRPMDIDIEFVPTVVYACCVLHNYCESIAAPLNPDILRKDMDDDMPKQDCRHHASKDKLYTYNTRMGSLTRECFKRFFADLYNQNQEDFEFSS